MVGVRLRGEPKPGTLPGLEGSPDGEVRGESGGLNRGWITLSLEGKEGFHLRRGGGQIDFVESSLGLHCGDKRDGRLNWGSPGRQYSDKRQWWLA